MDQIHALNPYPQSLGLANMDERAGLRHRDTQTVRPISTIA
jgi:hypothetical protein